MIRGIDDIAAAHGGGPAGLVLSALDYALSRADPYLMVANAVSTKKGVITVRAIDGTRFALGRTGSVYIVGAGKACRRMAEALLKVLGDNGIAGAITVPSGGEDENLSRLPSIEITEASHPVPDSAGLRGSKKIVECVEAAKAGDIVFVLLSGGGSALMPLPASGLNLADKRRITNKLLASGANINEMNIVRKHLSAVKGGQLAKRAKGARIVSLIISDVIGDDLSSIASGPTYPDPSTFSQALQILKRYGLADGRDRAIRRIISGAKGKREETPKPGDDAFKRVHNVLIGNNRAACLAAKSFLSRRRVKTEYLGSAFDGHARNFGRVLALMANDLGGKKPVALVLGGETTVKLNGTAGKGGRNQEAALACALKISEGRIVACMGTDGIDGNSPAAGALVSAATRSIARAKGVDLRRDLLYHDSYHALKAAGSLIVTGRTGTNVNDIAVVYSGPESLT